PPRKRFPRPPERFRPLRWASRPFVAGPTAAAFPLAARLRSDPARMALSAAARRTAPSTRQRRAFRDRRHSARRARGARAPRRSSAPTHARQARAHTILAGSASPFSIRLFPGLDQLRQLPPGAKQKNPDAQRTQAERAGNLVVIGALHVRQPQQLTLLRPQLPERTDHVDAQSDVV